MIYIDETAERKRQGHFLLSLPNNRPTRKALSGINCICP